MMNSLLRNFYNKYAIIYVKHSPKKKFTQNITILSVHRMGNLLVSKQTICFGINNYLSN